MLTWQEEQFTQPQGEQVQSRIPASSSSTGHVQNQEEQSLVLHVQSCFWILKWTVPYCPTTTPPPPRSGNPPWILKWAVPYRPATTTTPPSRSGDPPCILKWAVLHRPTTTTTPPSRSGDPSWKLKWAVLESSGQRLNS